MLRVVEEISHVEVERSHSGLYLTWLELYAVLWPVKHAMYMYSACISALTVKEKNAFKNQNGVTMVQAFKMEPGGHCRCGFRHISASLRT